MVADLPAGFRADLFAGFVGDGVGVVRRICTEAEVVVCHVFVRRVAFWKTWFALGEHRGGFLPRQRRERGGHLVIFSRPFGQSSPRVENLRGQE